MVPVEDGHLAERDPLVAEFEDLLGEEVGLLVGVGGRDDQGLRPLASGRDQRLGEARGVVGDRGVGEGDDLGRRPVVGLQPEDRRAGVPLGELEDVVVVRPSEPVDRLGVVADGREVPRAFAGEGLDQVGLDGVGVLHLVDQEVPEHPRLRGSLVGELGEEPGPLAEQVVVVHAVGGLLPLRVGQLGGLEVREPLLPVGVALEDDLLERPPDVEREAEGVLDRSPAWGPSGRCRRARRLPSPGGRGRAGPRRRGS